MIKISTRKNILYLLLLFGYYYLRKIDGIIISKVLNFRGSFIFTFLMAFGEFFGGLAIYMYQRYLVLNKKVTSKRFGLKLIINEKKMNRADGWIKIIILIFFAAFFDFFEFVIINYFIPRFANVSPTIEQRLCFIITISSSLICTYALRIKIGRHHVFALIGMGICSGIVIILELIYKTRGISIGNFVIAYLLVICHLIFVTFTDVTEKYLIEYNFIDAFLLLASEGALEIVMCIIYSFIKNPYKEIGNYYNKEENKKYFPLLIFLLILHFVFSAGINVYKILCNVFYSPMAKSLPTYFLNPIFIIYYFIFENDFTVEKKQNYFYFIMNVIISIFIDLFAFVYNEFFILYCFDLEKETHFGISQRSIKTNELIEMELHKITNNDENSDFDD